MQKLCYRCFTLCCWVYSGEIRHIVCLTSVTRTSFCYNVPMCDNEVHDHRYVAVKFALSHLGIFGRKKGVWDRLFFCHRSCYTLQGEPKGRAVTLPFYASLSVDDPSQKGPFVAAITSKRRCVVNRFLQHKALRGHLRTSQGNFPCGGWYSPPPRAKACSGL